MRTRKSRADNEQIFEEKILGNNLKKAFELCVKEVVTNLIYLLNKMGHYFLDIQYHLDLTDNVYTEENNIIHIIPKDQITLTKSRGGTDIVPIIKKMYIEKLLKKLSKSILFPLTDEK